ncbi:DSBA oxidoreductase [Thermaerobacter marianensis DSM 12885]|uniref:DSBA oxidoreductase n=1 Tax=Thermaerobacter marianensis (strain ATCC 700841 / DSM 12885 / JCM 10246 / 7p75a) TaxID=644966 RepID=E6SJF7_THEM7|nr:DsbA family protein [Thermaerobacter marianensis]ADU52112.1 DSBA oxidoreductase [Thermaerobacter marianensis DSM 12885]
MTRKSTPPAGTPPAGARGEAAGQPARRPRRSNPAGYGRAARHEQEARRRRLRWLTLATAGVVVLAVALAVAATRRGEAPASPDVFQLDRQPMLGSAGAPVTVVEFADFKCPYCREFAMNEFPRFREAYIDTGKVRFYFINYPFIGPDSDTAAQALEAIYAQAPEGVWAFIDRVMQLQGPEDQQWATPEFLVDAARQAVPGIDAERLAQDLRSGRYRDAVEADRAIARRVGVQGTPALFVNGRFVPDWSFEGLSAAVDEALAAQDQGDRGEGSTGEGGSSEDGSGKGSSGGQGAGGTASGS